MIVNSRSVVERTVILKFSIGDNMALIFLPKRGFISSSALILTTGRVFKQYLHDQNTSNTTHGSRKQNENLRMYKQQESTPREESWQQFFYGYHEPGCLILTQNTQTPDQP